MNPENPRLPDENVDRGTPEADYLAEQKTLISLVDESAKKLLGGRLFGHYLGRALVAPARQGFGEEAIDLRVMTDRSINSFVSISRVRWPEELQGGQLVTDYYIYIDVTSYKLRGQKQSYTSSLPGAESAAEATPAPPSPLDEQEAQELLGLVRQGQPV